MATYDVTYHGNGSYTVRDTTYDDPVDMPGFEGLMCVSSIVCYLVAFVAMIIMLCNLPSSMIFPGILAMVLFLVPVFSAVFGKRSFASVLLKIAKYAYLPFNLMVGMWWMLWGSATGGAGLLIGLMVVTMYAMYYFPVLLIYDGCQRDTALGIVGAVCSFVGGLAVYLVLLGVLGDTSVLGDYLLAVFPTAITVIGTLFLLADRTVYLVREGATIWRTLLVPALYLLLAVGVALLAFVVFPAQNADRYDAAMQCAENGDYKAAREQLAALGNFRDAAAQYEAIKFIDLQVGERVTVGVQSDAPDEFGENPLSWTVIAVKDGKALLLADDILTSVSAPSVFSWDQRAQVRVALDGLQSLFNEAELARIQEHTYEVMTGGTAEQAVGKLFLPSRAELEQYCTAAQIFAGSDTSYNDHQILDYQMADFDYTYIYAYFTRDAAEDGRWLLADCDADAFVSWSSAYRYAGIRPAMYITVDGAE